MLSEALILAGGLATRLGPLAADTPKALMPVGDGAFLDYLVWNVARHGVDRIVFALGARADAVIAHVGDGSRYGVEAVFSVEPEPLGTGGAARLALPHLRGERFLMLNGDTLFDLNYLDLDLLAQEERMPVAVALRAVEDVSRFGRVTLDGELLTAFDEKGASGPGLVNGGVYSVTRAALEALPEGASSFETDFLAPLVAEGRVAGRAYGGCFVDIGVPASLERAREVLPAWRRKPVVFFDRDGVLNRDFGHVGVKERFEWMPGAREAVKWLNDRGFLVIVVTNQSGIGRGLYSEEDFLALTGWISGELAMVGAHIDATYHCPHHPTEALGAYRRVCDCRKPEPGMLLSAIDEWRPDVTRSLMVGDSPKDMDAASRAGVRGVTYEGGDLATFVAAAVGDAAATGCS